MEDLSNAKFQAVRIEQNQRVYAGHMAVAYLVLWKIAVLLLFRMAIVGLMAEESGADNQVAVDQDMNAMITYAHCISVIGINIHIDQHAVFCIHTRKEIVLVNIA